MEKTKKQLYDAYTAYVVKHAKRPVSIDLFMADLPIEEVEFYKLFSSFTELEQQFWKDLFLETLSHIRREEVYQTYSIREKFLAFYYTWMEYLNQYRDFAQYIFSQERIWQAWPAGLDVMKGEFLRFSRELIASGKAEGEIADRLIISDHYHHAVWMQLVFLLKFWIHDKSDQYINTDAAIDKAVNFGMDLMEKNALDSFLDLSKFIIQKW
jgi:hypothetical protein